MAVNLPEIKDERPGGLSLELVWVPQQSQVGLDSKRRPTLVSKQLPACRWTGGSAGRCPIGCGLRTLSSPPLPLVAAVLWSRRFDLVWYASPSCFGLKLVAERLLRLISATQKMARVRWCFEDALRE